MSNFSVLSQYDEQLLRLGMLAEKYFADDPNTCLIKLRQLGESLAQMLAAFRGELVPQDPNDEPASVLLERIRTQRGEQAARNPKRDRRSAQTKTK